ncbi:hypothetical protein FACS1894160_4260 [Bacteroidia bacterium]|nr:hypothetical protein FACS1894160_4260 [Bacteroidia bacterium]
MRFRGVGAIVNIIAKSPVKGQSGRINGQLFPVDFYNGNFSSNYTYVVDKVRMSVYGSGNFFNTNKPEVFNSKDVVTAGKLIHTDKQSGKLHGHSDGGQVSALVDYEISSKSFASLDASYQLSSSKGYSPYSGSVYSDGQKMYNFQDSTERYYHNDKYTASAYYQTKFTPNSSMNTQVRYETGIPENSVLYKEITDQGGTSNMHQEDKEHWQTLETQINFMQEIKKVKIEEGYRLYWMGNEMNNNVNGMADQSNHVQWRNYFYANLIGSIKEKFVYQAGTGFDISKVLLNGAINDRQNVLVPQVTFRYNINNKQNVRLNYNVYREMATYSWYLNPTPRYNIDTSKVSFGNPNLTPYYRHAFKSSYSIGDNKLYFNVSAGGMVSTNPIMTLEYLGEDGIYYTTWVNTYRKSNYTYSMSVNYKFFDKLTVNIFGAINYHILEDNRYSQLNMHYRAYDCGANVSLQLPKFFGYVSYFPQFRNPTQTGYVRNPETCNIYFSYTPSNHLVFNFGVENLFPQVTTQETYLHDYTEFYRRNNRNEHLAFFMGFYYRFAYGKQMEKNRNVKSY